MKKILCICNHGNIRSVALKYLLWRQREKYPNEAIAIGILSTSINTLHKLLKWADLVIDLSDDGIEIKIQDYIRWDIGKDIWHNPFHPELHEKLYPLIKQLKEEWKN